MAASRNPFTDTSYKLIRNAFSHQTKKNLRISSRKFTFVVRVLRHEVHNDVQSICFLSFITCINRNPKRIFRFDLKFVLLLDYIDLRISSRKFIFVVRARSHRLINHGLINHGLTRFNQFSSFVAFITYINRNPKRIFRRLDSETRLVTRLKGLRTSSRKFIFVVRFFFVFFFS